ncbi:hypothetical protein Tco_0987780, partial [Tanacetum coccineum]
CSWELPVVGSGTLVALCWEVPGTRGWLVWGAVVFGSGGGLWLGLVFRALAVVMCLWVSDLCCDMGVEASMGEWWRMGVGGRGEQGVNGRNNAVEDRGV